MKRPRFTFGLLFWPFIFLIFFAATAGSQDGPHESVTIQLRWFHQFQFAGYYAAIEKGFYAHEGLHVSLREFEPGKDRISPVLEGKAQYGVADSALLKLRLQGKPVVILAQIFQHSPVALIALRESGIFSPGELVDKKVMIPLDDIGIAPIQAMFLETEGKTDRIAVVPHSYDHMDLIRGRVDAMVAYISNEPFKLKKKGVAVNIIDPRSYGIDFYGDNLFTTEKEINAHPDRVGKMIRATLKGWAYALSHKDEIIELIRQKYRPELDRDQLRYEAKVIDQMIVPDLIPIGDINPRRLERVVEIYHRLGMTETNSIPPGFLYDEGRGPVKLTAEERAWLDAHRVITLGGGIFPPLDDFNELKGRPEGIGSDYTELIGALLGIKFKYISDDWAKIQRMAKEKKIDGIRIMLRNKEREAYLNFTQPQTSIQYAIFLQKQSAPLRTLKGLSHKQVGVMGDTYSHSYLREHHPDIEVVPFKSIDDALFALIGGELDAVVASLTVAGIAADRLFITSLKVGATVSEMDTKLQIGVRKDWPQLVTILNKAIDAITPEQHREIKRKWITFDPEDLIESLKLSDKEKAWLAQDHTVRVRVANAEPYIFVRNGKPQGIAVELLSLISQRSGVKFRYIMPSPSFAEDLEKIARHEGPDLISTIMRTPQRETFLLFTKNYARAPRFIFTRHDSEFIRGMNDLSGKTVAVVNAFAVHRYLEKNHPEINLLIFKNVVDSLKAVSSGKVFAFIGDLKYAPLMITRLGLHNLKVAASSSLPDHVQAMATRNDWPELRSILNKGLDSLSEAEKTAVINKWTSIKVEYGIRPADILIWILIVVGAASGIVLLFVFWNRGLAKSVQERTFDLETSKKELEDEIDERKKAEQKLYEYQNRLKLLAAQLTVAEERERRSIAADLHDQIGQTMALARIQIAALRKAASENGMTAQLDELSDSMRQAAQDTQNLVFDLSSPLMNEIGLAAAVSEWLEEKVGKRYGLKTEFVDDGLRKPINNYERALLFRNVRELLTNAVKHAKANLVSVSIESADADLKIVVQDDGIGLDSPLVSPKGGVEGSFGLFSIQERMTDLGGALEIESEPGKGCKAILTMPLSVNDGEEGGTL